MMDNQDDEADEILVNEEVKNTLNSDTKENYAPLRGESSVIKLTAWS